MPWPNVPRDPWWPCVLCCIMSLVEWVLGSAHTGFVILKKKKSKKKKHCFLAETTGKTARVVAAPQVTSEPVFSIFLCSPLPPGAWRTPGLPFPLCCLPTSSSVCLVFFPFSRCLSKWFEPDPMKGRHDHATSVCVFFTMVRKSSSGSIAWWILARTPSLVTWSFYEMRSILL